MLDFAYIHEMREFLEDVHANQPLEPSEAARRAARPQLRKRFYETVTVAETPEGFAVLLDGKGVRTPARRPLALPARALADALAAEWQAQTEMIDPARMPLTRLANAIIDGVSDAPGPVAEEIAKYLGSDLLFYRADQPAGLVARQAKHWDPVLAWAHEVLGARFILAEGVMFVAQPENALAAARSTIPADPWKLGAANVITTLTGSALLALAVLHGRMSGDEAWAAAHVDEDWQADQWGHDALARERRAFREADMRAASLVLASLANVPAEKR
jgi:chaperone required for assembly of F1-ATPase